MKKYYYFTTVISSIINTINIINITINGNIYNYDINILWSEEVCMFRNVGVYIF